MEHFPNPIPLLQEMRRVARPFGWIVTAVPNKYSLWNFGRIIKNALSRIGLAESWIYGYEKPYTKQELENLHSIAGLPTPNVIGIGVFEGIFIPIYFALHQPQFLIRLLRPYLFQEESVRGKIIRTFAYIIEKMNRFGMLVIARCKIGQGSSLIT